METRRVWWCTKYRIRGGRACRIYRRTAIKGAPASLLKKWQRYLGPQKQISISKDGTIYLIKVVRKWYEMDQEPRNGT